MYISSTGIAGVFSGLLGIRPETVTTRIGVVKAYTTVCIRIVNISVYLSEYTSGLVLDHFPQRILERLVINCKQLVMNSV